MLSPNMTGSAFMVGAMALFTFNDAIVKVLGQNLPIVEVILLRGAFTVVLIGAFISFTAGLSSFSKLNRPIIWWRALCEVGATYCFLTGLIHVELANAAAILSALPLAVTIGSVIFLNEKVGWRRWSAIAVGFIGVLLIVRPGLEAFNIYSLNILGAVVFAAARDLVTKQAPKDISSVSLTFATATAITLSGAFGTYFFAEYQPPTNTEFGWLFASALLLSVAYFFIVSAMRVGEVAIVAPFRYTNLLWAIALGIIVFGDKLDWMTLLGSAIVTATGIYTLYRERVRIKAAKQLAT
ncbi:MAG: DMT family transporter [Hyphomicrobiales bacterium]